MNQKAIVTEVKGKYATVEVTRSSACDGCHKGAEGGCAACSLMGGNNKMRTLAHNSAGASVGDTVNIEASSVRTVVYAVLVFILPIILAAAGYALSLALGATADGAVLWAAGAFAVAFLVVWLVSRFLLSERCDIYVTEIIAGGTDKTEDILN